MKSKQKMTKKNTDNKNSKVIHENSICSECGQSPIEGIRYYCLNCSSYELCQKCEKKYGEKHGHQMLMLRRPNDLKKFKHKISQLKESQNLNKIEEKEKTKIELTKCFSKCMNLKKMYTTRNNNNFIPIEIIIKNIGDENWPTPCFFTCEEESEIKGERVKLVKCTGKSGEEYTIKIKILLNNIKKTGTYKSIWALKNENGEKFGEKVVFIVKDIFEKNLNLKNNENTKDYRDDLEKSVNEIKQKFDILFSTSSIRNALIRTQGNKENAIKVLYTEQKMGKYNKF